MEVGKVSGHTNRRIKTGEEKPQSAPGASLTLPSLMHWFSARVRRQDPCFLSPSVLTRGHRVCSRPLPAPGNWAPAPPGPGGRGLGILAADAMREDSATGEDSGERTGMLPTPAAPPLTCPVRVCRERKSSQSTSRVRRGLELRSRFLSLQLEALGSAAAAMTPSQQPPSAAKTARPRPSRADCVALRWRKTTASYLDVRVGPTLSMWQTGTETNQEQGVWTRRFCVAQADPLFGDVLRGWLWLRSLPWLLDAPRECRKSLTVKC